MAKKWDQSLLDKIVLDDSSDEEYVRKKPAKKPVKKPKKVIKRYDSSDEEEPKKPARRKNQKDEILMVESYRKSNEVNQFLSKSDFRFKYIFFHDLTNNKVITLPLGIIKVFNVVRKENDETYEPNLKIPFGAVYEEIRNRMAPFEPEVDLQKAIDDYKISKYSVLDIDNQKVKLKRVDGRYIMHMS
jgi:hypothetical protein